MPTTPASAADYPELSAHFGPDELPRHSIYPYSPVFPCQIDGRRAVLKRTRRTPEGAAAIAAVTRQWAGEGIAVVTPLDLPVTNPVFLGDGHWVAYPFIDGNPYTGQPREVAAAGGLLGRIHAAASGPARFLDFQWPDHDESSVAEDVAALRTIVAPHVPDSAADRLVELTARFMTGVLPPIRGGQLPQVNAVMDYKANNLIYTSAGPVLVDPDNGELAPRLLDLAQAALLFHTEHDPAPPQPFGAAQWTTFIEAYAQHVWLTDQERALWPVALEFMLSEEGHWALTNDPDQWREPRQRAFLRALAGVSAADYPLPVVGT